MKIKMIISRDIQQKVRWIVDGIDGPKEMHLYLLSWHEQI